MLIPKSSNHTVQELQQPLKLKQQVSPFMKSCAQLVGHPQGVLTNSTINQLRLPLLHQLYFRLIRTETGLLSLSPDAIISD